MNNDTSIEITELTREIMQYLDAHPGTADSLEGITQWWLLRQRYLRGLSKVENALDVLTERGEIEKIRHSDGTTVYRKATGAKSPFNH